MNDGGPAFPCHAAPAINGPMEHGFQPGMSLLDYFAAMALQGILSHGRLPSTMPELHKLHPAEAAYLMADAMLREREKSPQPVDAPSSYE
jgi:hypothetical protein